MNMEIKQISQGGNEAVLHIFSGGRPVGSIRYEQGKSSGSRLLRVNYAGGDFLVRPVLSDDYLLPVIGFVLSGTAPNSGWGSVYIRSGRPGPAGLRIPYYEYLVGSSRYEVYLQSCPWGCSVQIFSSGICIAEIDRKWLTGPGEFGAYDICAADELSLALAIPVVCVRFAVADFAECEGVQSRGRPGKILTTVNPDLLRLLDPEFRSRCGAESMEPGIREDAAAGKEVKQA